MKPPAIAIFVKTPGLSPVKTRLAATMGATFAEEFYFRSLGITKEIVRRFTQTCPQTTAYWAVAESAGLDLPLWKDFPKVWQGNGDLGERLSHVYERLREKHDTVCFIGADAPLLTTQQLKRAFLVFDNVSQNRNKIQFVLGPASDGGFYLFAGSSAIPKQVWINVRYSQADTGAKLMANLRRLGAVHQLDEISDVDTKEDLLQILKQSESRELLTCQTEFVLWIECNLFLTRISD